MFPIRVSANRGGERIGVLLIRAPLVGLAAPPAGERTMSVAARLKELGIEIPPPSAPVANYLGAVTAGNMVYVSGHGPRVTGGYITGKLGRDLTTEQGHEAAKATIIACLGSLQAEVGSLERVKRIVKLLGMVNCTEDFGEQPQVINGASDLLVAIFGESGRHARSAVGMQMLPMNIAVEIEMVVELHP
jgi:enamine deaminase RidA (YjgF/YER057c/UK114 family)